MQNKQDLETFQLHVGYADVWSGYMLTSAETRWAKYLYIYYISIWIRDKQRNGGYQMTVSDWKWQSGGQIKLK